jgi:hypothetical protein
MRRLAGAFARVLIVTVAALSTTAAARQHTFAQVKCVGLYCAIVRVGDPHQDSPSPRRLRRRPHVRQSHGRDARVRNGDAAEVVAHPAGCPHVAFCGCGVARYIFGRIDGAMRPLWLARAWLRFPRARPASGMVAVHRGGHHVLAIVDYVGEGRALAYDPNSGGHRTRLHVVSLRSYVVVDPHGG